MTTPSKAELLRRYYNAYLTRDRATVEAAFAEDFRFTSPYDDGLSKAQFFEKCWDGGDAFQKMEVEKVFAEGEEAFIRYRVLTKDGREFRNTEFVTFRDEQLTSVQVYFGATYKDGTLLRRGA
jgi:ketosteroid isomerase-like protein